LVFAKLLWSMNSGRICNLGEQLERLRLNYQPK